MKKRQVYLIIIVNVILISSIPICAQPQFTQHFLTNEYGGMDVVIHDIDNDNDLDVIGFGGWGVTVFFNSISDGSSWGEETIHTGLRYPHIGLILDVDQDGAHWP